MYPCRNELILHHILFQLHQPQVFSDAQVRLFLLKLKRSVRQSPSYDNSTYTVLGSYYRRLLGSHDWRQSESTSFQVVNRG